MITIDCTYTTASSGTDAAAGSSKLGRGTGRGQQRQQLASCRPGSLRCNAGTERPECAREGRQGSAQRGTDHATASGDHFPARGDGLGLASEQAPNRLNPAMPDQASLTCGR